MLYDYLPISALLTAFLSLFLDLCFREGMIFEGWLNFIADRWLKENKVLIIPKTDEEALEASDGEYETIREYRFSKVKWWWFKPLGYCVICMNVWISFIYLTLSGQFMLLSISELLYSIVLSNLLVRLLNKIL